MTYYDDDDDMTVAMMVMIRIAITHLIVKNHAIGKDDYHPQHPPHPQSQLIL